MKRAFVVDDSSRLGQQYKDRIERAQTAFEVRTLSEGEFLDAMSALEARRRAARSTRESASTSDCILDEADILVLDYDLLGLDEAAHLTGEGVAYLARCYSTCGLIIGLNQYGRNTFDLTLRGHPESYADLNLGGKQLDNPGLWSHPWRGFRPWHWPLLPAAARALEHRASDLKPLLDESVFETLGLNAFERTLPRSVAEFLTGGRLDRVTFRTFVAKSGNGLRGKDKPFSEVMVARIAAARVAKWLERVVLPAQDVLVDAPHLVSRYPSLLRGDKSSIAGWKRLSSLGGVTSLGLRHARIADHQFRAKGWLSRPAWFWRDLSASETIEEVREPWKAASPNWLFCEDASAFHPVQKVEEFVADVPSQFVRRFVRGFPGVDYRPRVRLSL